MERSGIFQIGGQEMTVVGPEIEAGQPAPEFTAHNQSWETVKVLEATQGKVRILTALPSLETGVCDTETRRFNEEAASLGEEVAVIAISTDLPYTQKRWCGAAGIDRMLVVSDHLDTNFGEQYGCLLKERRILRRAVFVIDREGMVVYADYMLVLGDEPNYAEVLEAARKALA